MMPTFWGVIFLGTLVVIGITRWYSKNIPIRVVLASIGSLVVLSSFLFLRWIHLGPPGSIESNAAWLAERTVVLDTLKNIPGMAQFADSLNSWTVQDVLNLFQHPIREELFYLAESGNVINGWKLTQMLFYSNFALGILFASAIILSLLSLITNMLYGLTHLNLKIIMMGEGIGSGIIFLLILISLPSLDTFGMRNDITLRFLSILAESRVANGAGWFAFGFLMLLVSNVWPFATDDHNEGEYE